MIRHVFKLVWNRKRSTGLILVEILICFLVLCAILASGAHYVSLWQRPLGFDYEDIWMAEVGGLEYNPEPEQLALDRAAMHSLIRAIKALPEVEAVALATNQPYSTSAWIEGIWIDGKSEGMEWTLTSTELLEVFRIELLYGRWLEETDGALNYTPVVISQNVARDLFGMENPLGQTMPDFDDEGNIEDPKPSGDTSIEEEDAAEIERVVGVVADVRRRGEFRAAPYRMYVPIDFEAGEDLCQQLAIRVRPGTTAEFEERLVRTMQNIGPEWTYETQLLESRRRNILWGHIGPLLTSAIVTIFLVVMVGLGLVGVLWLSVTRRTSELGLRRAMGASGASVRRQVLAELWALTTLAVVVGALIFLQLPLFGVDIGAGPGWSTFIVGLLAAVVVIFVFVSFCGLYPAWLATRVQPAMALQYE